jgi:hypothetical protein
MPSVLNFFESSHRLILVRSSKRGAWLMCECVCVFVHVSVCVCVCVCVCARARAYHTFTTYVASNVAPDLRFMWETQLREYLQDTIVSEDDPAVVFIWNKEGLVQLASSANTLCAGAPAQPEWVTTQAGNMTGDSLAGDLFRRVATVAGGNLYDVVLAPNSIVQYGNIIAKLRSIEDTPFFQHHAASFTPGTISMQYFDINYHIIKSFGMRYLVVMCMTAVVCGNVSLSACLPWKMLMAGTRLATVYYMRDRTLAQHQPSVLSGPEPPLRQLFF